MGGCCTSKGGLDPEMDYYKICVLSTSSENEANPRTGNQTSNDSSNNEKKFSVRNIYGVDLDKKYILNIWHRDSLKFEGIFLNHCFGDLKVL